MTKQTKKLTAVEKIVLAGLLKQVAADLGGQYGRELRRIRRKLL
jgi:hypothetical protein